MLTLSLTGCDIGLEGDPTGDDRFPFVTEILEIRVEPSLLAVGDTTLITCVVRDSTNDQLRFIWGVPGFGGAALPVNGSLEGPQVKWVAPDSIRDDTTVFGGGVRVSDRVGGAQGVAGNFRVTVTR
ncbi:MAG: hypothetical protein AAF970_12810 [Bacteroidota bacterium]